ncbi:hypothetical protein PYW07_012032 [Mythimna separata]|uniref:Uncharacterized protein n=1 Tax=Mythimna separata TaxID=271217 RepID=A0AAD7YM66_MYTSE|nr:hypothetical protein PYW07_012032 [Mythimna separata]
MFLKPLRLDIKRKLTARSDRVKCVDQHPTEPWLLCSLYNGDVNIWNYETHSQIKRFEVCDLPVRSAKFVPRKNWVITGSDDMQIRMFNYNTLERVRSRRTPTTSGASPCTPHSHTSSPGVMTC